MDLTEVDVEPSEASEVGMEALGRQAASFRQMSADGAPDDRVREVEQRPRRADRS